MLGRAAITFVLILAGCATPPPSSLYVRPGLTTEELAADNDTCMAEARAAERAGPRVVSDGTVGGAVAAGVQNG